MASLGSEFVNELTLDSLETIKNHLEQEANDGAKVEIDLRRIYHDYLGVGSLLNWMLSRGVRHVSLLSDVPLASEDSIIDMMCKSFLRDGNDDLSTRERVSRALKEHSASLTIECFDESELACLKIELP